MTKIYSVGHFAHQYANKQFPDPAPIRPDGNNDEAVAKNREERFTGVFLRNRAEYNWKVTAFNLATAALIGSVAFVALLGSKLFFLVGCAAYLARKAVLKELTIDNHMEPDNVEYMNQIRASFGVAANDAKWISFNPVEIALFGYQLWMNPVPTDTNQLAVQPQPVAALRAPVVEEDGGRLVDALGFDAVNGADLRALRAGG